MKIFISAVTSEFGKVRDALRSDLRARGHEVVVQSDFQQSPDSETLLGTLADYIRDCHAVICVVGKRAGAAPPVRAAERLADVLPQGIDKASYTQWEFFLARHYKRRPYVYLAKPDYVPDKDAPGDDTALQGAYLAHLKAEGIHYGAFSTADELRIAVLRDEPKLAADAAPPQRTAIKPIVLPYPSLGALFKGREDFMRQLGARLSSPVGKTVVIGKPEAFYGLGGVGKTRAAVEYAWAHQDDYSALLFVVAETPEALRANLVALTAALAPHLNEAPDNERLAAVLGWLRSNAGWLLILDNADSKPALAAVEGLLQELHAGQVLVTSRLSDFSANFAPLPLDVLSLDDGVAFLLERTKDRRRNAPDDEARAREIATEVDRLALALEQAAAYIAKRRLTFELYLEQWRAADHSKVLDWFDETVTGYKRAVAVTWQTSVAQLTKPGRRMLERLAFLAPEPVPEFLIDVPIPGAETENLHEALDDLAAYSLVTRGAEGPFFLVHRLVQDVTRRSLADDRRQQTLEQALAWINEAFPNDPNDVRNWPRAETLLSHAQVIITEGENAGLVGPIARLMNEVGLLLESKALYAGTERLYQRSLAILEKAHGAEHVDVSTALNNLAGLYFAQGRYAEADPLFQRSLEIREKALGPDDPIVATALNNLAELYREQGRYAEAQPLNQRCLAIREKALGSDHVHVGIVLSNLGRLYHAQRRDAEAEPLFERSLAIREKAHGPKHPDVIYPLNNLAALYHSQHRYAEAQPLLERSLELAEGALGPDHPIVGTALNNLAQLHRQQGNEAEAVPLYRRSIAISEKVFGPDHPDLVYPLNNLATLYSAQGRHGEAQLIFLRCIGILKSISKQIRRRHPNLEPVIRNYAGLLAAMGQSEADMDSELQRLMHSEE